jgi:hypothetical protein
LGSVITEEDATETIPSVEPGAGGRSPKKRRRRRRRRIALLSIVIALLAGPGWSLGHVLAANNTDPLSIRVVEWARDHRLGGIVGAIENTWYAHHQPRTGGEPKGGIPHAPKLAATHAAHPTHHVRVVVHPPNIVPFASPALPGEGVWQPTGRLVRRRPVLWVTYMRPDATHTSLLAGVAHLDMSHLTATLHAGTDVPGGGPWVHGAQIDAADYPYVVAAFNSGFRLDNSGGGYYAEGRTVQSLVPDRASFVTYADGHVDVGLWGRDDYMSAGVTAVRQNLGLIVDGGKLVPGLADSSSSQWGGTVGNKIYVWRSGVGIDAHHNLVYVAGPGLNVETLAEILRRAGCVRAMELDINTWWTSFTDYTAGANGTVTPANLLPSMVRSPSRYLSTGTRDFIEIDTRH